ncbi:hypothetical protein L211DRAFT_835076 [Terfezia boudieri ATCC MYA-4762]|uniref:Uncharacterized protein n=1 Tax=Terfezia boudieri ATCC MYA-4762 TaxID=1051890 RepID=A0A3N4LYT0_9PEZI|nr:hypothetical protein L211DRAFT_835076 [Terfezia boudieri ATCC MYA-4762]
MASRLQRSIDVVFLLFTVVVILGLIPVVYSVPVLATTGEQASSQSVLLPRQNGGIPPANTSDPYWAECGFDGDQDMYGLGIRIGYYVQWIATVLGAYYTPQIVSSAFEANAIFNIGMLAGLVYSTMRRNNMFVVEPVMVLGFSIGGAIVGLLDPKNVHNPKSLKSLRARLVHLCGTGALSLPLLTYWTWYSFYGMSTMQYNHCARYTFFIVKIDIWSPWFRYFMRIATIISLVGLFSLAVGVVVAYRKKSEELPHHERHSTGFYDRPRLSRSATALAIRARPTKTQFFVVIVVCAICALSVELGIMWNKITGVNALGATGQLIPLAIGIITSIKVVAGVVREHFKSRSQRRKESANERFFGGGGEVMSVRQSLRRSSPQLDDGDTEGNGYEVLNARTLAGGGAGGKVNGGQLRRSSTSMGLGEKRKISPASTSDSQETMHFPSSKSVKSMKSTKSTKSTKSGKLTKEMKEKDRERAAVEGCRDSMVTLPTEPGAAMTRGAAGTPSVISVGQGRKKLQRDPSKRIQ